MARDTSDEGNVEKTPARGCRFSIREKKQLRDRIGTPRARSLEMIGKEFGTYS